MTALIQHHNAVDLRQRSQVRMLLSIRPTHQCDDAAVECTALMNRRSRRLVSLLVRSTPSGCCGSAVNGLSAAAQEPLGHVACHCMKAFLEEALQTKTNIPRAVRLTRLENAYSRPLFGGLF